MKLLIVAISLILLVTIVSASELDNTLNYDSIKNIIIYFNNNLTITLGDIREERLMEQKKIQDERTSNISITDDIMNVYDNAIVMVDDVSNFITDTVNNLIPEPENVLVDNSSIDNFGNQSVVIDNSIDVSNQTGLE
jgi:hypothetical protein